MFCKYCGKEIPEGGVCDCGGAAANMQGAPVNMPNASVNMQSNPVNMQGAVNYGAQQRNIPNQGYYAPVQNRTSEGININVTAIKSGVVVLFKNAFLQPVNYLRSVYSFSDFTLVFGIGILYVLLQFILPFIEFKVMLGEYIDYLDDGFVAKFAFFVTLIIVISKAVITAVPVIVRKMPLKNMLAVVCAALVMPIILRIISSIGLMLNLYGFAIAVGVFNSLIGLVYDYEVITLGFDFDKNKAFWFFLIAEAIIAVIAYVIGYNVVIGIIKDAGGGLMGDILSNL